MSDNFGVCESVKENHQDNIVAILSLKAEEYRDNMLKSRNDAAYLREAGDLETSELALDTADTFERMMHDLEDTIEAVDKLKLCNR